MPEAETSVTAAAKKPAAKPADRAARDEDPKDHPEDDDGSVFTPWGVGSAVLGVLCVVAVVLTALMWSGHRREVDNAAYESRIAQTAIDWTIVLINMNSSNVDASLKRLHDGTVGRLYADFDKAMQPYSTIVKKLQSNSKGQIDSVSIESLRRELDPDKQGPQEDPVPGGLAKRTDNVLIVATSVAENAGAKPQVIRWNLRVSVSDVEGKLLVSRLESIK